MPPGSPGGLSDTSLNSWLASLKESIVIYLKLGIEGRKDLSMQAPIDESNSGDELKP